MTPGLFIKLLVGAFILSVCFNLYQCDNGRDLNKELSDVRLEIKGVKKDRDSLRLDLISTRDSLDIAFTTIKYANYETQKAREEKQFYKAKYEKSKFIGYRNDHERDSVLSTIFSSFSPVR